MLSGLGPAPLPGRRRDSHTPFGVTMRTEQADLTTWDWPVEAFDVVVGIFFQFAGPPVRKRVFDGIKQALKPGGYVLLQGYGLKQLEYATGGPKEAENLYTRELLEKSFADFSSIEIEPCPCGLSTATLL